jgi:hypothetical protein
MSARLLASSRTPDQEKHDASAFFRSNPNNRAQSAINKRFALLSSTESAEAADQLILAN